jgi:uncharacterized membrane protein YjgN (DUF898 family)
LSATDPHFETVRKPETVNPQKPENATGWTCPQCGLVNREDLSLCSCGYDFNRPALTVLQKPGKVIGWKCPQCDLTNHEDMVRCSCGYDPGEMQKQQRELALKFHGSAREYFRIWIVNLCLTLFTLGIFSAWAKVRKKRYFYSHTTLDGTPFQYLGRPVPILKGRVIAGAAFLTYYASSHFFTFLLPYVFVLGAVFAPWVLVRSAAFNARYSAFRNMTFHFDGGYRDALKAFYVLGVVPLFILGMTFDWWGKPAIATVIAVIVVVLFFSLPWWIRRLRDFLISHSSYGGRKGSFFATGGQFFGVYFVSGLMMFGILILVGLFSAMLISSMKTKSQLAVWLLGVPMYAGYVLTYAYVQAHTGNLVWNNTWLGPLRFKSTLSGWGMAKLYVTNALGIIASLGLLIPWAVMRTLKYRADHMRILLQGELAEFQGSDMSAVEAIGAETVDFFDMDLSL